MNIPDEILFEILEIVSEEHEYNDDAIWRDAVFGDHRWTLTKRERWPTQEDTNLHAVVENVAFTSSNVNVHREQVLRSVGNKLVSCELLHWRSPD